MAEVEFRCDVLVIGGGPAGSTFSAILAELGWEVVLLEQKMHPRFHIGESLLPLNIPILQRLGVLDHIKEIGIRKYGIELNFEDNNTSTNLYFSEALGGRYEFAFEVKRSEFDAILFDNAISKGVLALTGTKVNRIELHNSAGPLVTSIDTEGKTRKWQAKFLIDASGRDTVIATKLGLKTRNPRHASASIFSHFEGVKRLKGRDEGNISLFWFQYGWFWLIPLKDGTTSVGVVFWPHYLKGRDKKTNLDQFFLDTIRLCPNLAERMQTAKSILPTYSTGNYTYSSKSVYGENFLLIGDAASFIDPVFSTGVYVAMKGGLLAADAVNSCLRDPKNKGIILKNYKNTMDRGLRTISWLIYRMTAPAMQHLFKNSKKTFGIRKTLMSILSGNIFDNLHNRCPYFLFKCLYYIISLVLYRQSVEWWRMRRVGNARASIVRKTNGGGVGN